MSSRWHEYYERGRPSYPVEAVHVADIPSSSSVLEIGAGTGKLTRVLIDEYAAVVAVEPDPHMRLRFTAVCHRARLLAGAAEALPVSPESADAVFAAEAFHWFDHPLAVAEISRVLRPRGALVLMWNRPAGQPDPPVTAVENLLEPLWPKDIDMPLDLDPSRFDYARDWPRAFEDSMFEPLQETRFANTYSVNRDELVAFFGSMGWIGGLPDEEAQDLLDEVRSLLVDREYRLPFETDVHWTRLAEREGDGWQPGASLP
jgi:SAM-dependent methyltransferase